MKSLGRRITLLLILAIVTVVVLATLAAWMALRGPLPEVTLEPMARQLHASIAFAELDPQAAASAGIVIRNETLPGSVHARFSRMMTRALSRTGPARTVEVLRDVDGRLLAQVRLEGGNWAISELPDFSPPVQNWYVLAGWMALIVIGSTMVSIFAASKIIRPVRLIEDAVLSIGPDGVLPPIPETGWSEARATAAALNRLSSRLKHAMESRMRLVAAAGHDLRTPMTRMRLRAEFLPDDADRERWLADLAELDMIADSAIRLVREEASRDGSEIIDVAALVADIVDELEVLDLHIGHAPSGREAIVAGPMALKRAFRNLLVNAATHGREASIAVSSDPYRVSVRILDKGPGIPEDLLAQVFEPFFRVDIARRKALPGAGLGLAIAREIIERFGGTVTLANRPGGGLAQTVSFPRASSNPSIRPAN